MAQKQEQYEGALDSIFNFIFASNKKSSPPPPPKPVKGDSDNEMAYALGEIAGAPAIYASEEALNVINEPLDNITIASANVKLDSENSVRAKITLANAAEFFNNPDKFIDGAFTRAEGDKKAAKQLNRIRGLGGILDLGIGAVMARSIGAPPIDSVEIGTILGSESLDANYRDNKAEELVTRASALEVARAKRLDFNQANKQAQIFTSVMEASRLDLIGVDITKIHERENIGKKNILVKKLKEQGITDTDQIDTLLSKYAEKAERYKNKEGYDWNLGSLDKGLTKKHSKDLDYSNPAEWVKSDNPADKLRALKYEELEAEIALLSDNDPKKLEKLKQKKHIELWQLSNGGNRKWGAYFGEASVNIQHANQLIWQGGALPALISGDFFDKRKNNWTPSEEKDILVNGKKYEGIHVARDDQTRAYTWLNNLYYFTPASIGKTLFVNGEGFVYFAGHRRQQKIRDTIAGSGSIYNYVSNNSNKFSTELFEGIDMSNQKEVLDALSQNENYLELLNVLKADKGNISDTKLLELFGRMEKLQAQIKNSLALKYADAINQIFKGIQKKLSLQAMYTKGLTLVLGKKLGAKAAGYLVGGKVALKKLARALAKKAVHAVAQALGVVFSAGVANILIVAVTEVIFFIGEKLLKPVMKLAGAILWVLGVLLVAIFISAFNWFGSLNPFSDPVRSSFDTAGNTAPIFCVECGANDIYGILPDDDVEEIERRRDEGDNGAAPGDPSEPDPGSPPPPEYSDVDCPLGSGSINCSQGPYRGFSHGSRNAIDTLPTANSWYAPSDGVITRSIRSYENSRRPGQLCGGIVTFVSTEHNVTHQLVHVVPHVTNGQQVQKGQLVATMAFERDGNIHFSRESGTCTTGPHFHLELMSGTSVYADRYYVEFLNCNLNACPGRPKF